MGTRLYYDDTRRSVMADISELEWWVVVDQYQALWQ